MKTKLERLELIQEEWIMKKIRAEIELKLATKVQLEGQPVLIKIQQAKSTMLVCDSFISFIADLMVKEKKNPTELAK